MGVDAIPQGEFTLDGFEDFGERDLPDLVRGQKGAGGIGGSSG